jgi:hypothetical protein
LIAQFCDSNPSLGDRFDTLRRSTLASLPLHLLTASMLMTALNAAALHWQFALNGQILLDQSESLVFSGFMAENNRIAGADCSVRGDFEVT